LVFTANAETLHYGVKNTGGVGSVLTIDNISVRELPGNHAYQTTATSRPVLSARYNLLTKTEQFDDAAWGKSGVTVVANAAASPDDTVTADFLFQNTENTEHRAGVIFVSGSQVAASYTASVYIKFAGTRYVQLRLTDNAVEDYVAVNFDLVNGVVASTLAGSGSIQNIGDGWFRCVVAGSKVNATQNSGFFIQLRNSSNTSSSFTGDGTSGIYIWGADLRVANDGVNIPPYQRVNTETDYDTQGFPLYLRCDGVDDGMVTNSIDFTATDKMTVFAGVRKLSDVSFSPIAELSPLYDTNTGVFAIGASGIGYDVTRRTWVFGSKGTASAILNEIVYTAPITNILTGIGNISGDRAALHINGAQVAQSTTDQGTGNYGNYPLYIGRRGGTTLPFNGHLYSLIVRGAATTDTRIAQTERWVNKKTGAY
jgi:hypothetical protein